MIIGNSSENQAEAMLNELRKMPPEGLVKWKENEDNINGEDT